MDQPNRINSLAFTVTGKRQTPKNEFGQVLSNVISGAMKTGAGIIGSIPGVPVVSAAVNAVQGVVSTNYAQGPQQVFGGGGGGGPGLNTTIGGGGNVMSGAPDRPVYENSAVREMAAMSDYYMKMQNEMQRESREFNAVSNIIKVRHDSAKAAINNIR
ncbi:MAG: hypothetical protein JNK82_21775 [Myxococcaceae bacterium]|nr:hypothetical protein [Myxococcaceae bacterium]